MQKAWREHYPELLRKYRARLFGPIEQQQELAEAITKVAERRVTAIMKKVPTIMTTTRSCI